jgi:hypothetical protein
MKNEIIVKHKTIKGLFVVIDHELPEDSKYCTYESLCTSWGVDPEEYAKGIYDVRDAGYFNPDVPATHYSELSFAKDEAYRHMEEIIEASKEKGFEKWYLLTGFNSELRKTYKKGVSKAYLIESENPFELYSLANRLVKTYFPHGNHRYDISAGMFQQSWDSIIGEDFSSLDPKKESIDNQIEQLTEKVGEIDLEDFDGVMPDNFTINAAGGNAYQMIPDEFSKPSFIAVCAVLKNGSIDHKNYGEVADEAFSEDEREPFINEMVEMYGECAKEYAPIVGWLAEKIEQPAHA